MQNSEVLKWALRVCELLRKTIWCRIFGSSSKAPQEQCGLPFSGISKTNGICITQDRAPTDPAAQAAGPQPFKKRIARILEMLSISFAAIAGSLAINSRRVVSLRLRRRPSVAA